VEKKKKGKKGKNEEKKDTPPVFTKKENATLEQRIKILNWHHENKAKQKLTAEHFNKIWPNLCLKQPIISEWLRDEVKWWKQWEEGNGGERSAKRARQTQHSEVTKMMDLWVSKAMAHKLHLTGEVLRQKWLKFAELAGVPQDEHLDLSEGWLSKFKRRHGLKEWKRHGEAASADSETVEREQSRIQELIKKYGYELRDIFNMDETVRGRPVNAPSRRPQTRSIR
jgi:hypothetical protein